MSYIKAVHPMEGYRLLMEMESGSTAIADLSGKLSTIKFAPLADQAFFQTAETDGDYVIWGGGQLSLTVNELMEVVLLG